MDSWQSLTLSDGPGARAWRPLVLDTGDADEDVVRYAKMSLGRVDKELIRSGIDPKPTVTAILAIVTAAREVNRRILHRGTAAVSSKLRSWATAMRAAQAIATRSILTVADEMRRFVDGIVTPCEIGCAMPVRLLI
jgi:hypothetical protein